MMAEELLDPVYINVDNNTLEQKGLEYYSVYVPHRKPLLEARRSEPSSPVVHCTYCIYSSVPAVKSCLLCEASLCSVHLEVHSTSPEHVLTIPLNTLDRLRELKCSIHKEVVKYYCYDDSACICVACCLTGNHKGHVMEPLDEASGKKKKELQNLLDRLNLKQDDIDQRVQRLKQQRGEVQDRTLAAAERVTSLFSDLRKQLEELERQLLCEISEEQERIVHPFSLLINQLEAQQEELKSSITQIEQLLNLSDPMAIMTKANVESLEPKETENLIYNLEDMEEGLISIKLHSSLNEIMDSVKMAQGSSDLILDVKTAANNVYLSGDKKTISWSKINQRRPKQPFRFKSFQALSIESFTYGHHYWEVQTSDVGEWMIGVSYPNIDRKGTQSVLGHNDKSWCLRWKDKKLVAVHDQKIKHFANVRPCNKVGIYLDFEAGRLSFYNIDDPISHLHTFMATFTQPLFAAFSVERSWLRIKT